MANLSNINNKFLFTDGDFLKIGNGALINQASSIESGLSITNANVASITLTSTGADGKTFLTYANSVGSYTIYDIDAATPRLTINTSGTSNFTGDVYILKTLNTAVTSKVTNLNTGSGSQARFVAVSDGGNIQLKSVSIANTTYGAGDAGVINCDTMSGGFRIAHNDVTKYTLAFNGENTWTGGGTFGGNLTAARGFFNSGSTNVVATFTSTDGTATLQCADPSGNVEFGASGDNFVVQPAGGVAQLTVSDSITKVSGMLDIIGSRSTYVQNAEDDTATSHIFTTDSLVGDFAQLAGSLVLQARVNDAIYRDIILAGGLGTAANPVAPILTVRGEAVVQVDGSFVVNGGSTFANMITINIDDISTGENRGVRIINTQGIDQQWNITAGITGVENDSFCIRDSTANVNTFTMAKSTGHANFSGNVELNDTGQLQLGTGNDVQIYHNNSHFFADNNKGNSYLRNTSTGDIIVRNSAGGDIQFDNEFAGNILFNTSNVERMRIRSNGAVGIGIDNAVNSNVNLRVVDNINSEWIAEFKNTNTAGNTYGLVVNTLAGAGTYNLGCYTHSGNGFFVKNNGTVGIGLGTPISTFHLSYSGGSYGTDATSGFINQATTGRGTQRIRSIQDAAAELFFDVNGGIAWDISARESTGGHPLNFYGRAATPGYNTVSGPYVQFFQNGNVTIAGTLTENSDISLKENIKPLESQLEIVSRLNPVSYNKIGQDKNEIGFIAQEVEELLPELVLENEEGLKSLAYGRMNAILVKAIQELKADNDSLKARIETLENN